MYDNNTYGSVITEQGDLGLGITPIHENTHKRENDHNNGNEEQNNEQTSK